MNKYYNSCFLLLVIALFECSCQNYYAIKRLGNNFCETDRTLISFLTQSINKYEVPLTYSEQSVILEKRFNSSQVKRLKSDCKITIETKGIGKNPGLYVNILKMKMRQQTGVGINQGACIDSIQVKIDDKVKKRFCGELDRGEIKSLEDHSGKVKITISIDKYTPFTDPDDFLEFQIVVTVFKDCHDFNHEYPCKKNVKRSCISSNFVNDSIVNCIEPHCSDEKMSCLTPTVASKIEDESATIDNLPQIFLSAITSLIITMICCGCCFLFIFKIKRFCSPPPPASITTRVRRRSRRSNQSLSQATPTAPAENDLPPAYDELFPHNPNRAKEDPVTNSTDN